MIVFTEREIWNDEALVPKISEHERRVRQLLRRLAPHAETYLGGVDAGRIEELAFLLLKEIQEPR